MKLRGVNKKCAKCAKECKQWMNISVRYCPSFTPIDDEVEKMEARGWMKTVDGKRP